MWGCDGPRWRPSWRRGEYRRSSSDPCGTRWTLPFGRSLPVRKQGLPFAFRTLAHKPLKTSRSRSEPIRNLLAESERAFPPEPVKSLPLPDKPSIAVLPFANMSGDPEQEYFADGVVEDIITALSRFRWLFVIARNSSFTYKGRAVDTKQVGRELGVRYVLEGSIRKSGNRCGSRLS